MSSPAGPQEFPYQLITETQVNKKKNLCIWTVITCQGRKSLSTRQKCFRKSIWVWDGANFFVCCLYWAFCSGCSLHFVCSIICGAVLWIRIRIGSGPRKLRMTPIKKRNFMVLSGGFFCRFTRLMALHRSIRLQILRFFYPGSNLKHFIFGQHEPGSGSGSRFTKDPGFRSGLTETLYCDGNSAGLKSGRRNVISSPPVLACKIRKDY